MGRVILADTSAWVELQRGTGSAADRALTSLLEAEDEVVVTEPVIMELLSGARSRQEHAETRRVLLGLPLLRVGGLDTYERAASIARRCRAGGEPIRRGLDCLIAAVAISGSAPVLHADRDFDVIARHTALQIYPTTP